MKPSWCKHKDCKCLGSLFGGHEKPVMCCGCLFESVVHDGDKNTHRVCLAQADEDYKCILDLQVCKGDLFWFDLLFNTIRDDVKNMEAKKKS